ncbi:MAG: hypothetical protein OIF32_06015 [Campylobacterales bacterium]|nr:hypothetical protein [Campylobacterales bacterium]
MNVGGTLNTSSSLAHTFSKPVDHDYRNTTIQEKMIDEASLTKTDIPNPYEDKGVPNFVWQIFTKASDKADLYTQKNVESRLFSDADENTDWSEKVSNLQASLSAPVPQVQLNNLVEEKNIILEQFSQPRMSPSEEKNFKDLIVSRQKAQGTILDAMMVAITALDYKPLEVAA